VNEIFHKLLLLNRLFASASGVHSCISAAQQDPVIH